MKRAPEYICGDAKHGVYSMSAGLPLILGVLVPNSRLEILRFYNVLNVEKEIVTDEPLIFDHKIFRGMSSILEIRMTDSKIAQILGWDQSGTLIKIQLNMTATSEIILFSNISRQITHTGDVYISEKDAILTYIDQEDTLLIEQVQTRCVPA